ncbi:hypothetical protein FACS189494_11730 [Spirochaetia bacterium]|nr:hypothetical protein FACS189494_11730 [Spirochaetia bacterium]
MQGGTYDDWQLWADGKKEIERTAESPALEWTSSLFRRRLSQLSKMTVQVLHDIMPIGEHTRVVFSSFRGEITQQFKINRLLALEGGITPAAFSNSVFNTPVALAAISEKITAGYTAVYPCGGGTDGKAFTSAFLAAISSIMAGEPETVALCYADELIPAEYSGLCGSFPQEPMAFAALLSKNSGGSKNGAGIPITLPPPEISPQDFLKICIGSLNVIT